MGIFGKKSEPNRKYTEGQCLVWRRGSYTAYGVVVRFRNDLMFVDIRESNFPTLVAGAAYWFTIDDRDWSDK